MKQDSIHNRLKYLQAVILLLATILCACTQNLWRTDAQSSIRAVSPASDNHTITDPRSYYLFLSGQRCMSVQDWPCAISEFTAALEHDPSSPYLHLQLAHLYTLKGEFDEAITWCKKAVGLDPGYTDAHYLLGRIYASLNRYPEAVSEYSLLLEGNPDDEEAYLTLATLHAEQKNYRAAVKIVQQLLTVNPKSETGYFYLGNLYTDLKKYDQAEKHYNKALELMPGYEPALINLALLYEEREDIPNAMAAIQKILEVNPENYRMRDKLAYLFIKTGNLEEALIQYIYIRDTKPFLAEEVATKIGLIYFEREQWELAAQEFTAALKINQSNDRLLYYKGSALEKINKLDEAVQNFSNVPETSKFYSQAQIHRAYIADTQGDSRTAQLIIQNAIKAKKDDIELYRFLASLHEKENNIAESIKVLNEALDIKRDDEDVLFYLGVLYDKASMAQESIDAMQAVLKINSQNAEALNFIGYTYADKGINLDEAERLIKKALKLKPDDGYITDSLGWVYFKKGELKKALKELERAVTLAPKDPVIMEHLADACLQDSQKSRALQLYQKALELDPSKTDIRKKIDELANQ